MTQMETVQWSALRQEDANQAQVKNLQNSNTARGSLRIANMASNQEGRAEDERGRNEDGTMIAGRHKTRQIVDKM